MKWDKVKKHVAANLYTVISQGRDTELLTTMLIDMISSEEFQLSRDAFPVYADKAVEVVMAWDIRCVGQLRDLFPWAFPVSLRKGGLVIAYDSDEDWAVNAAREFKVA